ncbi:MAG: hypothetical protein Q9174_000479 [Haloplaca sp. 1 TL-2023]
MAGRTAPLFAQIPTTTTDDPLPSSSAAFGTPVHPIRTKQVTAATTPSVLPISLPPASLRPLAFRSFTKKHNLTLTSSALQALADFIGTHCGSGWREEGLAEKVLDEAAKTWKRHGGGVIVAGESNDLADVLRNVQGSIVGGRVDHQRTSNRHEAASLEQGLPTRAQLRLEGLNRDDSQASVRLTSLDIEDGESSAHSKDPRSWLKVINAFEMPRFVYNASQKHFQAAGKRASILPDPSRRTALYRDRYQLVHQRLLRNEAFQTLTVAISRSKSSQRSSSEMVMPQQAYKLTPIANLLGRPGSTHVLLGLLGTSPTGELMISDLTGSITLDLQHARPVPEDGAWFTPGMIVLAEGLYEEEEPNSGPGLAGDGGVGGTIGGKFHASSIGGPPCERRDVTLGVSDSGKGGEVIAAGGFGWVDFLGVGRERADGPAARNLEKDVLSKQDLSAPSPGNSRMIILGEVNLDSGKTLEALRHILGIYATEPSGQTPMTFVLIGNFVRYAVLSGGGSGGSIEYKEYFDSLASVLSEFPSILKDSTFVCVPGDNDPWASAFSAGAATVLPQRSLPEIYTTRVKRAFAMANSEAEKPTGQRLKGEVVWSTNPARLSLFGPAQELVVFRDNISGRLRRRALRFRPTQEPDMQAEERRATVEGNTADGTTDMEIDQTIEAAESEVPDPRRKDKGSSNLSSDLHAARKLVKTVLDQGYLSPFPLTDRPVLWDFSGALNLYPLPTALVLMDPEAPSFALTYEGCHAMNPGVLVVPGKSRTAQWIEYDARMRKGKTKESKF